MIGKLNVERLAEVELGSPEVSHLSLSGNRLVYSGAPEPRSEKHRVVLLDLGTAEERLVAESEWDNGNASWPEISGDWVVYGDRDRVPFTMEPGERWALYAVNVKTGDRTELASSGGEEQDATPLPFFQDGVAIWSEFVDAQDPSQGITPYLWRPEWDAPRAIPGVSGVTMPTIIDDEIVYIGYEFDEAGDYTKHAYVVPLEGGAEPRQLSGDESVEWLHAADGVAVWSAIDFDAPGWHWSRPVDGSEPARMIQHGESASNVAVGSGFATWMMMGNALTVSSLDGAYQTRINEGRFHVPSRIAVDGDRLAFVTMSQDRPVLHVFRITDPRSE